MRNTLLDVYFYDYNITRSINLVVCQVLKDEFLVPFTEEMDLNLKEPAFKG